MSKIYDINNDKYFQKYLKYKIKYLELHNELDGGDWGIKSGISKALTSVSTKISSAATRLGIQNYTDPALPTTTPKLKSSHSDNNDYVKTLIKVIETYPLSNNIKKNIGTNPELSKAKKTLTDALLKIKIIDTVNINEIDSFIKNYLAQIDNCFNKEKDLFSKTIHKYKDFAKKIYTIYYDSSVVSYSIIDNIYRKLLKEQKIYLKIIDYKENKDNKKTELLDILKSSSEYNEQSPQSPAAEAPQPHPQPLQRSSSQQSSSLQQIETPLYNMMTGEFYGTTSNSQPQPQKWGDRLIGGEGDLQDDNSSFLGINPGLNVRVIPLKENINLNNRKVTYNVNDTNTTEFKSTVLITPNNEYYYELSILYGLGLSKEEIDKQIDYYFNIYIHLLYIYYYIKNKSRDDTDLPPIDTQLEIIIQYIRDLLVSTEISYHEHNYKINSFVESIEKLEELKKINSLINSDKLTSDEIQKFFDIIIKEINIKRFDELKKEIDKIILQTKKTNRSNTFPYRG